MAHARRHYLQRGHQRVRGGRAGRESAGALRGAAESVADADVINYSASFSACEKGVEAERALELVEVLQKHWLTPDAITCSASISACEKGVKSERTLKLFWALQNQWLTPTSSFTARARRAWRQ